MPRNKPPADTAPARKGISIPAKVYRAAISYGEANPDSVDDFSDLVTQALREYIEGKSPGLIAQCAKTLRDEVALKTAKVETEVDVSAVANRALRPAPSRRLHKNGPHRK